MRSVNLGDRVKDQISGLTGIVTGISQFLFGCRRLSIQPERVIDAKPAETFWVDEPQVRIVKRGVIDTPFSLDAAPEPAPSPRRAGPRPDAKRRTDAVTR